MRGIGKEFYGARVLKDVTFTLGQGQVLSLVGENGAGKSTLMNILFGMPVIFATGGFEGEIYLDGEKVDITSPEEAMELGIGMVHQEFMLLPGFTITENIKLNRELTKESWLGKAFDSSLSWLENLTKESRVGKAFTSSLRRLGELNRSLSNKIFGSSLRWLDVPAMRDDARTSMDSIGLSIDEMLPVRGLPVGHMQFVEIARELDKKKIRLLVLDEPTAVLTESDAERLLEAIKLLIAKGISIIFISHRLDEVMKISDKIVVLRDGELVSETTPDQTSIDKLAELMVGRKVEGSESQGRPLSSLSEDIILEVRELAVDMPGETVQSVTLNVRRGEVLGIGGLAGQGKIGIANGIMGLFPSRGSVKLNGEPLNLNDPRASLDAGLAFVSEDRRGTGLLLDDSIEFNIAGTAIQIQNKFMTPGPLSVLDKKAMTAHAREMIRDLDVRCTGPRQLARRLSGGNQQKVCVARAITLEPTLLLVSEPTRGIDIGAKKLILDRLVKLNREQGLTIIMTSSELAELRLVCDRIAIICRGKLEGILSPQDSDRDFGLMMAGEYHRFHGKEAV
ncbi:MAG: sugar ABC transporter ATP-binding protein [Fretibacterium sp.]|nr:sugar ABC transporter ATP-binding protein [Fretibacterium sp.]